MLNETIIFIAIFLIYISYLLFYYFLKPKKINQIPNDKNFLSLLGYAEMFFLFNINPNSTPQFKVFKFNSPLPDYLSKKKHNLVNEGSRVILSNGFKALRLKEHIFVQEKHKQNKINIYTILYALIGVIIFVIIWCVLNIPKILNYKILNISIFSICIIFLLLNSLIDIDYTDPIYNVELNLMKNSTERVITMTQLTFVISFFAILLKKISGTKAYISFLKIISISFIFIVLSLTTLTLPKKGRYILHNRYLVSTFFNIGLLYTIVSIILAMLIISEAIG